MLLILLSEAQDIAEAALQLRELIAELYNQDPMVSKEEVARIDELTVKLRVRVQNTKAHAHMLSFVRGSLS